MEEDSEESKNLNRLKELLDETDMSARILGLCLNIHKGTLSNWNTNATQPNLDDVERIADLLEEDNHKLVVNKKRTKTGLAEGIVREYKRLTKEEKLPLYVQVTDKKTKKLKKVYNPELFDAMWVFIEKHKEEHGQH